MPESLDVLIARAEADEVAKLRGNPNLETPTAPRPLPPALGEPPLVGAVVVAARRSSNGYRGQRTNMMQRDERYRKFARELFFSGFDQEAAYYACGYGGRKQYVPSQINSLLKQPVVIDELNRLGQVARETIDASAVDCVKFWKEMAEANIFKFFDQDAEGLLSIKLGVDKMPEEIQRTVKRIKVRKQTRYEKDMEGELSPVITVETDVELWDRHAALVSIAKTQGLFKEADKEVIRDFAAVLAERLTYYEKHVGGTYTQDGREVI